MTQHNEDIHIFTGFQ